jgi:hypothetical protein
MSGARDRKRAERQKRKRRSTERTPTSVEATAEADDVSTSSNGGAATENFQERMARRYEERNEEARAKLEPLEKGERPAPVTAGAIVSALLAIVFTVSEALPIITFGIVLWAMTIGMWRARYWAVLGFQTVLLLVMLASAFGLVVVSSVLQAVGTTLLLAGSATLFYFMIRAMARIQMPESPGAD